MILALTLVFTLQVVSTAINTLKTIFITKGISKPAYILTFIDAIMFAWAMKLIVSGDGFVFLAVFATGKTLGTILGDLAEKKLAVGTLEVTIMAKKEKAIEIADHLRDLGYSVNTKKVFGIAGVEKFDIVVFIQRKEFVYLRDTLKRLGIDNATMVISDVSRVTGKIQTHHYN
jgi:uncharacterized protein YebE (UPF0316 family)